MIPLVVGGSSGIGLAIAFELWKRGSNKIYIVGKDDPTYDDIDENVRNDFKKAIIFLKHNFTCFDIKIFSNISDIDSLIITCGFGRVALFSDLNEIETSNLLKVNFDSVVKIIKHYYPKISSNDNFYTCVFTSISGYVVSPFLSVYGATKSGLRMLIENINCELELANCKNRILDVSPGYIKGTNFYGKGNDLSIISELANDTIDYMLKREVLFIPQYDSIYKSVIQRYQENPNTFGRESYEHKLKSGRISVKPQGTIGFLSGTFDLFHIGHLNLLRRAKEQCDYLIVSVHKSGDWKGKETFIPYDERKAIISSIVYVDEVADDFKEDSDAWNIYHYNKLFVGSDYKGTERFNRYEEILKNKADIVYFPYTKGTSSTQLRVALKRKK